MIAISKVREIERLLRTGSVSQREIARQMSVSRGTVSAIALGRRPERTASRNPEQELAAPAGPLTRCPGCGGLVLMPCLLCRVRTLKERQRWPETAKPTRAYDRRREGPRADRSFDLGR